MRIGVVFPQTELGGDAGAVRAYAQRAEELGFTHVLAYDHVVGADPAVHPGWDGPYDVHTTFHEPLVLYGYLAAVTSMELVTGVIILPQRQTVLVAKQAASLDVLSGGRFRFGIGVGWNPVEFVGLNENFHDRGKRQEEQVRVMRALWAEPHVSFKGQWHTIEDAGINPLPARRTIPIWFGGHADATLRRIAKMGDGWMMLAHARGAEAEAAFAKLRRYVEAERRDPRTIGLEVWVSTAEGGPQDWRKEFQYWQGVGVTHVTVNNTYARGPHRRIAGRTLADHLRAMKDYLAAVADLL